MTASLRLLPHRALVRQSSMALNPDYGLSFMSRVRLQGEGQLIVCWKWALFAPEFTHLAEISSQISASHRRLKNPEAASCQAWSGAAVGLFCIVHSAIALVNMVPCVKSGECGLILPPPCQSSLVLHTQAATVTVCIAQAIAQVRICFVYA